MPKLKTKSGAKKRFRITRNGKVMKKRAFMRHNQEHKSAGVRARLNHKAGLNKTDGKSIKKLMPYN